MTGGITGGMIGGTIGPNVLAAVDGIEINGINFPDYNFMSYVLLEIDDGDGGMGLVVEEDVVEIAVVVADTRGAFAL